MTAKILNHLIQKILVVGPIYDQLEKMVNAEKLFSQYERVIFNGNVCYPDDNMKKVQTRIELINIYCQRNSIYNLGNYDLKLLTKLEESDKYPKVQKWLKNQNNVVVANYQNHTSYIITCGGITPKMTKEELLTGMETTFVSKVNDAPWHRWYGGGYGYVISNLPLTVNEPQFYNFSCQIGNVYSEKVSVYAQEVGPGGLGATIPL